MTRCSLCDRPCGLGYVCPVDGEGQPIPPLCRGCSIAELPERRRWLGIVEKPTLTLVKG